MGAGAAIGWTTHGLPRSEMKCVRNSQTDEVRRVSEVQATRLVISGPWTYAPKSLWKARQRAGGKNKNVKE